MPNPQRSLRETEMRVSAAKETGATCRARVEIER